jgi:uncharacterized DUF497 family protein
MGFRIHWTEKAAEHIAPHGIRREEVDAAVSGPMYFRVAHGEALVIGHSGQSLLFVVLVPSAARPGFVEVVTARRATRAEKRLFRRRAKVTR